MPLKVFSLKSPTCTKIKSSNWESLDWTAWNHAEKSTNFSQLTSRLFMPNSLSFPILAFWCFGLSVLWNFGEKWLIIFFFGFLKNHCTVQKKDGSCEWRAAMVADAKTLYEWGRWASELNFWPMYYPPVNRRGSSLNSISLALLRAELALVQYILTQ